MTSRLQDIEKLLEKAKRSSNEKEMSQKGYYFGKKFYEAGECTKAIEWLTKYIRVNDRDYKAHKLLGDVYVKVKKPEKAVNCYKQSLHIKPKQNDLILLLVQMHINPGPVQNISKAEVWLDKASLYLPGSPEVYKLRIELLLAQEASPEKLEQTFKQELKKRPNDPSIHLQFTSFLKERDRIEDAFEYVKKTFYSPLISKAVNNDLEWNQCLMETCHEYSEEKCDDDQVTVEGLKANCLQLLFLAKGIWLCLEQKKFNDAIEKLAMLDSYLYSAVHIEADEIVIQSVPEWPKILQEVKGQLYWMCGIYLIHLATVNELEWKNAGELAAACFGASLMVDIPDLVSSITRFEDSELPKQIKLMGSMRLSQCYHGLRNLSSVNCGEGTEDEWLKKITDNECNEHGQHRVFDKLFSSMCNPEASITLDNDDFNNADLNKCFDEDKCVHADIDASSEGSLQTWIWTGLQYQRLNGAFDVLPWICSNFESLQLAVKIQAKWNTHWNLSCLDVETFVIACVVCAEANINKWRETKVSVHDNALDDSNLPLPLGKQLTTKKQTDWWEAACAVYGSKQQRASSNSSQSKAIYRHGIECIRSAGNHGMQLALLVALAKHFCAKAHCMTIKDGLGTSSSAWKAYQSRAAHYWMEALPFLQDVISNKTKHQILPKDRLFTEVLDDLKKADAENLISEVFMCHGALLAQQKKFNEALQMYGKADTPHASFCQALIYKQLMEDCSDEPGAVSPSVRRANLKKKLLTNLEITMNRLHHSSDDNLFQKAKKLLHENTSMREAEEDANSESEEEEQDESKTSFGHNKTVNSGLSDSSMFKVLSKQSTPKEEPKQLEYANSDRLMMNQMSENIQALTQAVSNLSVKIGPDSMSQGQGQPGQPQNETMKLFSALTQAVEGLQIQMKDRSSFAASSFQQMNSPLPSMLPMDNRGTPLNMADRFQQANTPQGVDSSYFTPPSYGFARSPFPVGNNSLYSTPQAQPMFMPRHPQAQQINDLRNQINAKQQQLGSPAFNPNPNTYQQNQQRPPPPDFNMRPHIPANIGGVPLSHPPLNPFATSTPAYGIPPSPMDNQAPTGFNFQLKPSSDQQKPLDGTYMNPPSSQMQNERLQSAQFLKQMLNDNQASPATNTVKTREYGEIQFPSDFKTFTKTDSKEDLASSFQTPEEIDVANQKLEKDEQEDDANTSHNDTGPHFKPLVSLPEVAVVTGEEDEDVLFNERCKLYRFDKGEWKERGLGNMKVLKSKRNLKIRLLMRREQVFKICCNHFIIGEMNLEPLSSSDRAWVWQAIDFYEGENKLEKLAVRFKTTEIAQNFKEVFEDARTSNSLLELENSQLGCLKNDKDDGNAAKSTNKPPESLQKPEEPKPKGTQQKSIFGATSQTNQSPFSFGKSGFSFKPAAAAEATKPNEEEKKDEEALDDSAHIEFTPIAKMPDNYEAKTGEENEKVIFTHRAKLFRFTDKQWKERGIGDIKILYNSTSKSYRIVMRREQVMKVCANHRLSSALFLKAMGQAGNSWIWTVMDFSEETSGKMETFAVRFKLKETADEFKIKFEECCSGKIPESSSESESEEDDEEYEDESSNEEEEAKQSSQITVSEDGKLKMKKDASSWSCPTCMVDNPSSNDVCACCNTDNPNSTKPKTEAKFGSGGIFASLRPQSTTGFSFGGSNETKSSAAGSGLSFGAPSSISSTGTTVGSIASATDKPSASSTSFSFGAPANNQATNKPTAAPPTFGFGFQTPKDETKPKEEDVKVSSQEEDAKLSSQITVSEDGKLKMKKDASSWSCPTCMVDNPPSNDVCACCNTDNPNSTKPKTEAKFGSGGIFASLKPQSTTGFSFGASNETKSSAAGSGFSFGAPQTKPNKSKTSPIAPQKFSFGSPSQTQVSPGSIFEASKPASGAGGLFGAPTGVSPSAIPRFPSVEDDDEEDEVSPEDSDYTTTSDEDSESDEYELREDNEEEYKEPEAADDDSSDDVIYVGEILPSKELQDKAEKLQLPKHFYNYLNEDDDDDDEETEGSEDDDEEDEESNTKGAVKEDMKPINEAEKLTETNEPATATEPLMFGGGSSSLMNFADLAKNTGGFQKSESWVGLKQGKPLFSNLRDDVDDDQPQENEERDDLHFEPIMKLPDKVDLVSGEEDDEKLFSERCKLYRFNEPTKEWKERGLGDIKIMRHKITKKIRIVMRREQVHKVCANHFIETNMFLTQSPSSNKAWVWVALDFTDIQDPQMEKFTARFKTEEIAQQFKEQFDICKQMVEESESANSTADDAKTDLISKTEKMKSELNFFKDKFSAQSKIDLEHTLTEGEMTPQKQIPLTGLSLTPLVAQHQKEKRLANNKSQNIPSFQLDEGDKPETSESSRKPTISTSEDPQMESPNIHFEPIIKLPDECEVKTGEEQEDVVFKNRGKLYVFDSASNQWKERGIGDVKILQHTNTFKARIVMRREQVHKVCMNHCITSDIQLTFRKGSDKILSWFVNDFSDTDEPNGKYCSFNLRFKTTEIASIFHASFIEAQKSSKEGRRMDVLEDAVNTSIITSPKAGLNSSQNNNKATPANETTPVKGNVPFSFGQKESFLDKLKSDNKQTSENKFNFGIPKPAETTKPSSDKFSFNMNKMSFNFASTSTPVQSNGNFTEQVGKPTSSKTLFGDAVQAKSSSVAHEDALAKKIPPEAEEKKTNSKIIPVEDEDVIFVSELKPTDDQLKRAESLQLPSTFYLYEDKSDTGEEVSSEAEDAILEYMFNRYYGKITKKEVTKPSTVVPVPVTSKTPASSSGVPSTTDSSFGSKAFGFGAGASFKDLLANVPSQGFKKDPNVQFPGAGKPMFSTSEDADDYTCTASFQPIIKLKELNKEELKTGEEDEEILFKERSKIFRYDTITSQWKEKGVGELKVLFHESRNYYRVVMRREQVLKLCANHFITKDTVPKPHMNSDVACTYLAMDFSGGEAVPEQIAIKFKKPEIFNQFINLFQKIQEKLP